ncbi:MAG: hypothetical protein ACRD47_03265 [Nitrososphaeraceae archaeon]
MKSDNEKRQKHNKREVLGGAGMRMGYHSEKASPEDPGSSGGMRMGYHSEKANPPQDESVSGGGSGGMRMGYHSEKANPSKHSKRLHKKSEKN